jgi:hypothetical protein
MEAVVSEEVLTASGDLAYWQERAVRAEYSYDRAETDAAALRAALTQVGRMFTIKGVHKIAEQALAKYDQLVSGGQADGL